MDIRLARYLGAGFLVALLSITASAYTIVMRDGRRISISDDFIVTNTTLTYVAGDRIQVTLQLVTINIAATERANNEPPGSLLTRANLSPVIPQTQVPKKSTDRSLTNEDLQKFRVARLANEAEYEKRQKELGLPSLEELRRQAQLQTDATAEAVRDIRERQTEEESYWRQRASVLRAEIASTNARIDFVRARLNELPNGSVLGIEAPLLSGTIGSVSVISPFRQNFPRPNIFRHPFGSQLRGRIQFGGGRTHGRIFVNSGRFGGFRNRGIFPFFSPTLVALPFQDFGYERSELLVQLDELLSQRAGLQARWRDLEEEARRAGAYPGWLRP